jgi:hypothetical protein
MKELLAIGVAILAGITVFAVIVKRWGGECLP